MRRCLLAGALILAALSLLPTGAIASRPPTPTEQAAIEAATAESAQVPPQASPISEVRVSADGRWARSTIHGLVGPRPDQIQDTTGIYRSTSESTWTVALVYNDLCVGPVLTDLGMPRAVGFSLGFRACARQRPGPVYVVRSLGEDRLFVRPHRFYLSADGTFGILGVRWLRYGEGMAIGRGRAYANDCEPICLGGHFYRPEARIRLSRVTECAGRRIYSRMRIVLRGPVPDNIPRRHSYSVKPAFC